MSVDATKILYEGFLQKRKDTMKIRWATYWFRLQNTTLFFYTKENGSASHLKGYYYIYTVQSVREVDRAGGKRFMFEINMTNGKRKMLAAQTAALRKEWVEHLWRAMHLSTSTVSESKDTDFEEYEQQEDIPNSSEPICSDSESVMESRPARPLSAPAPPVQIHSETRSEDSPIHVSQELDSEEATYQNISLLDCNLHDQNVDSRNNPQWSSNNTETQPEGDYDVLPARKQVCDINVSPEMDEDVYDIPISYRSAEQDPEESIYDVPSQDPEESIYDVPSSILRNMPDDTSEEQHEEELYWKI